ncbi:MAG TPA: hypothetical protein VFA59_15690 [Vicinamibacterales bacterium]|nr:hypothetical protein [Vicinamibacterales bacterium]
MTDRELEEYRQLRSTIRERGTARVWIFAVGTVSWAALAIATVALTATPLGTLVPLMVLAAVFEAVYALHIGVERIGRYLHVFFEGSDTSEVSEVSEYSGTGWEHVAMSFGKPDGAATVDALFLVPFVTAVVLNLLPAMLLDPTREELIFVGGAHALVVLRLLRARAVARRQRAIDLARFETLKSASTPPSRNTAS